MKGKERTRDHTTGESYMTGEKNRTGYFLFSLDTELAWGHFDCFDKKLFSSDGKRERKYLHSLIDALNEYDITATWALVGLLFKQNKNSYPVRWKGMYAYFERLYDSGSRLLHGSDIIEILLDRGRRHEIAFHGMTHSLFDESTMNEESARAEIVEWLRLAGEKQIRAKAVVFPRNKIGFLDIFKQFGFVCYRGETPLRRVFLLPSLVGSLLRRFYYSLSLLIPPPVYVPTVHQSGMVNLPSSYWLSGLNRKAERVLDSMHLQKMKIMSLVNGVRKAGAEKKVIHVWAHPYEFQTEEDIQKLRYLFSSVAQEVREGRLISIGMSGLAERFLDTAKVLR